VADAAIGELRGVDVMLFEQVASLVELVGGGLPVEVEEFLLGADETFRFAVTIEAPFHEERVFLPEEWHLVDGSVAG
jgi:hypothetical protein